MSELVDGPTWLTTIDLVHVLAATVFVPPERIVAGGRYVAVRMLVRLHGHPLGEITLPCVDGRVESDVISRAVSEQFGATMTEHLGAEADCLLGEVDSLVADPPCSWRARLEALATQPPLVSVVLATYRRPERLARTLRTLVAQTYPNLEIIVVDNSPGTPGAAAAVESLHDARIRLLEEPLPGASRARNTGLWSARGEYVAFTDDDVDADPDWVGNLVIGLLEDPLTACTTGLILPLALESQEQRMFERFGGFSKGFSPRVFALTDTDHGPLFPYTAGMFGSGACSAYRRDVLTRIGGFPVDLGPATTARGGEDLDVYLSVLYAGFRLRYEPAALVRHDYNPDADDLARQVFSYGLGISAMITRRALASRAERRAVLRAVPAAVVYVLSNDSPKNVGKKSGYPRSLTAREIAGIVSGPGAYLLSRWHERSRSARSLVHTDNDHRVG